MEVTQLGYGAMEVRGKRIWGGRPCTREQARTILASVLDAGINFVDTANDYGTSELFIGELLADRREEFFLATKCGCHMQYAGDHDETPHVWTRENIMRNISDSLLKMRTDHVDILQLHNPDVETCEEAKLVDILEELKKAGVTRFIGCSSTSPHLKTYIDWGVFDVFQIPYSALQRQHENRISDAAESEAGVIIRGGVARGEPGSGLGGEDRWQLFRKARLDELREDGESPTAFLLRFTLSHPHCHTTIVGTLQPEHLKENVAAACRGPLPPDVYEEAKKRLDAAGEGPEP
jgi:aryl-alcohol dehydrogenase-like predicted oxidoreductase